MCLYNYCVMLPIRNTIYRSILKNSKYVFRNKIPTDITLLKSNPIKIKENIKLIAIVLPVAKY